MSRQFLIFYIEMGLFFGIIAGLMAFLITYYEFLKRHPSRKYAKGIGMKAGLATFIFFLLLSVLAGFFLPLIIGAT